MKAAVFVVFGLLVGCKYVDEFMGKETSRSDVGPTNRSQVSPSANAAPTSTPKPRQRPLPDLVGQTAKQAETTLRAAGFTVQRLTVVDAHCNYRDDKDMVDADTICSQAPLAGTVVSTTLMRVEVAVEHDTYDHGGTAGAEWRRMPAVVGHSLADAREALARAQLPLDRHFELEYVSDPQCPVGTICGTRPEGHERMTLARKGKIYVGKKIR